MLGIRVRTTDRRDLRAVRNPKTAENTISFDIATRVAPGVAGGMAGELLGRLFPGKTLNGLSNVRTLIGLQISVQFAGRASQ